MTQYTIMLGLLDKDSKTLVLAQDAAIKHCQEVAAAITGGATISPAGGVYTHDSGETITEPSIRIELLYTELEKARELAEVLKMQYNQESVLLTAQAVEVLEV